MTETESQELAELIAELITKNDSVQRALIRWACNCPNILTEI